jgi:hypothetical protein
MAIPMLIAVCAVGVTVLVTAVAISLAFSRY